MSVDGGTELWFTRTPAQEEMQSTARSFMERYAPIESTRKRIDESAFHHDVKGWKLLQEQLGGQAVIIPPEFGGMGFGLEELCILLEEAGVQLAFPSLLSTAAQSSPLLMASSDAQAKEEWLSRIANGTCVAATAYLNGNGRSLTRCVDARLRGSNWRLNGSSSFVLAADACNLLLVVASTLDDFGVFVIDPKSSNVRIEEVRSIDQTRPIFNVHFQEAGASRLAFDSPVKDAVAYVDDFVAVCLAAEQVGGATRCLEMAVEYSKQRRQFGKQIGSFQAIQHMCADAYIAIEAARSTLFYATWAHSDAGEEFPLAAASAKVACSEAYLRAASLNIQIHGTMGYTYEHTAPLYYRRAKWTSLYGGPPSYHRARIADLLGF